MRSGCTAPNLPPMITERMIRSFDGTQLYVTSAGTGPALLFCDGLGCDGYIWKYLRQVLAPHYRLIFWHYRGHGKSSAPGHPYALNLGAHRSDLLAVMDALELPQVVMLGHSMGVQLLLDLALWQPERIGGLVLLCGGPGRPLDTLHGSRALGRAFPVMRKLTLAFPKLSQRLWSRLWQSELCHLWAHAFEVNAHLLQREDLQPYFDHLGQMDVQHFMHMVNHLQTHTVVHRLAQVQAPALIVAGEQDTLTPVRLSEIMQERMPLAELVVVPRGSHVAPLEKPELVNAHVMRFVADCNGSLPRRSAGFMP